MSDSVEPHEKRSDRLIDEASAWFARLDAGNLEQAELSRFQMWLAADLAHGEALADASRTWRMLGARDEYPPVAANDSWSLDERSAYQPSALPRIAAAVAAVFALVFVILASPLGTEDGRNRTRVATDIGEHRVVDLPDGSQIELNTGTVVEVAYSDSARTITLYGGEAYFDVAHDPNRPFLVETGSGTSIRAIGTAFNVYVRDDSVNVIVAEGVVEVSENADGDYTSSSPPIQLVAGQQIDIGSAGADAAIVEESAVEQRLSWRAGMIWFDDNRLDEVLAEFARYTPHEVVIADDELRAIRIGGFFRTDNVAMVINYVAEHHGVRVERPNANETRLYAGDG